MSLKKSLEKELMPHIDPVYRDGSRRFFKEQVRNLGVRTPIVRKIARKHFPKGSSKRQIFASCETLLDTGLMEYSSIAFSWAYKIKDQFIASDITRFEKWIQKYVDNWALCDDFCTHSVGHLIYSYPETIPRLFKWSKSKNLWERRAAAVTFIYPIKKKRYLNEVFKMADTLLTDSEDMVQKGYGWMLKEASNVYPAKVYDYVMRNKKNMPRTSLRYAIEKYPKEMRKEAMKT